MSGICGIFNFNGPPVARPALAAMADAAAHRGPDGIRYWISGNAGLAHLAFNTTPQSRLERQPTAYLNGRYVLAADARIDNRDDLLPRLFPETPPADRQAIPDTDVIFAAFMKWRTECPKSLIGTFAFAIWDSREQRLFAARDTLGTKPLFYWSGGGKLVIATNLNSVLSALGASPGLNLPWIEDFVRDDRTRWMRETVYEGVYRLPPTYCLTASRGKAETASYYTFGDQPAPLCSSDGEWVEAFRDLFGRVVTSHLRSATPVGIHQSGGLDSSSISCTVRDLGRTSPIPHIVLLSVIYRDAPDGGAEEANIRRVMDSCPQFGAVTEYMDHLRDLDELDIGKHAACEEPDVFITKSLITALYRMGSENGCPVVLNGDMSNYFLGDMLYVTPRALRAVPLERLPSELPHFMRVTNLSVPGLLVRAYTAQPLLDLYHRGKQMLPSGSRKSMPWIKAANAKPNHHGHDIPVDLHCAEDLSIVGRTALRFALSEFNTTRMGYTADLAARAGIELRLPYADRRIIEFAVHLPMHLACSGGIDRIVLRESVRNVVPEQVRTGPAGAGTLVASVFHDFSRRMSVIETLLRSSVLNRMGFVDPDRLLHWVRRYGGGTGAPDIAKLQLAYPSLVMEKWLQQHMAVELPRTGVKGL